MNVNANNDDYVNLLSRIESHLSVLAAPLRRSASRHFEDEILRTDPRKAMFRAFDGQRTMAEVGQETGVTSQAVRDLVRILEPQGFVSVVPGPRGQVVKPQMDRIVTWHLDESGV